MENIQRLQAQQLHHIHGTGLEYIWEETEKISNISYEATEEDVIFNMPDVTENENYKVTGRKFNWSKLYGTLGERRI